jgi:hypothetical protein
MLYNFASPIASEPEGEFWTRECGDLPSSAMLLTGLICELYRDFAQWANRFV